MLLADVIILPIILCYCVSAYLVLARVIVLAVSPFYDVSSGYGVSLCDRVGC